MWFPLHHWAYTYTTVTSSAACATGWGCPSIAQPTPAQSVAAPWTPMVTTGSSVEGTGTTSPATIMIQDVVFAAAQSAALAPSKEPPCSQARVADIFIPNWSLSRPATLDIHVISPLQDLTIAEAALNHGHTLEVGVQRKLASNLSTGN